jgi:hypothetical protein
MTGRPAAAELLERPGALLDRRALAELGLQRRSIDFLFRECPVVVFPGVRRAYVRVEDYLRALEQHTYTEGRVRPG